MKKKKGLFWLAWLGIPLAAVIALLAAGTAGYFLYLDSQYDKAVFSLEVHEYNRAKLYLTTVASFYKDSPELIMYAQAGEALESRDYANARMFYTKLGAFRDCKEMLTEVDYRVACDALDAGDNAGALKLFTDLTGYKDSPKKIDKACQGILDASQDEYRNEDYQKAKDGLQLISGYEGYGKTVKKYLTLIEAHGKFVEDGLKKYNEMKALYGELAKLGDFEDAEDLRASDPFILYRLEGSWRYGDTKYVMTFRYDYAKATWFHNEDKVDWYKNKFDSRVECYYDGNSWDKMLRFDFLAEDRVEIFLLFPEDKGESYIYTREK